MHMHVYHVTKCTRPPNYTHPPTHIQPPHNTHKEMDHLEDDAVVYKLVGPVLVRQELSEARQTVEKRLDYISKEL